MISLLKQIQEIRSATSKKEKYRLLRKHDSPAMRQLLFLAFSPTIMLGMGTPAFEDDQIDTETTTTLTDFLTFVRKVQVREVKGTEQMDIAYQILLHTPRAYRWIVVGILEGNLRLGGDSIALVRAAFPDLIPTLNLQCSEDLRAERLEFPGFASPLIDGLRCLAVVTRYGVRLFTSGGNPIDSVPHIEAALKKAMPGYYDGKLYHPSGRDMTAHFTRSKFPRHGHDAVQFHICDFIPESEWSEPKTPAKERFLKLDAMFSNIAAPCLELVEHTLVGRNSDLLRLHKQYIADGFAGSHFQSTGPYLRRRGPHYLTLREPSINE